MAYEEDESKILDDKKIELLPFKTDPWDNHVIGRQIVSVFDVECAADWYKRFGFQFDMKQLCQIKFHCPDDP